MYYCYKVYKVVKTTMYGETTNTRTLLGETMAKSADKAVSNILHRLGIRRKSGYGYTVSLEALLTDDYN